MPAAAGLGPARQLPSSTGSSQDAALPAVRDDAPVISLPLRCPARRPCLAGSALNRLAQRAAFSRISAGTVNAREVARWQRWVSSVQRLTRLRTASKASASRTGPRMRAAVVIQTPNVVTRRMCEAHRREPPRRDPHRRLLRRRCPHRREPGPREPRRRYPHRREPGPREPRRRCPHRREPS
jgi:hypothetical protein